MSITVKTVGMPLIMAEYLGNTAAFTIPQAAVQNSLYLYLFREDMEITHFPCLYNIQLENPDRVLSSESGQIAICRTSHADLHISPVLCKYHAAP